MKSKAPLVMMEQIIMVLIFALAAALCLQTFVLSSTISKRTEAENRAAVEAQNAAEVIKAEGLPGYLEEQKAEQIKEGYRISFDADWNVMYEGEKAEYYLLICPNNSDSEYLWYMNIIVTTQDGTELFRIPVAGQKEVAQHE